MDLSVSVIGLGKLGASMAAVIASKGLPVIGVDVSKHAIEAVNAGRAPVSETGLAELIAANRERLRATQSHKEAVLSSDLSFVIVPTPSDERGGFSLQYAARAFKEMGRALADKRGYHVIVLTSTVLPGSTRYGLLPVLERASGKKCGPDFGLCYSPQLVALGSVVRDFLNPDFTLVGEFDARCGAVLESSYATIMENHPPCMRMTLENAELTKVALNGFLTMKITYGNMLVDLCERIPGGDVDVVTRALGRDRRIGEKYLKGALGYGGPCFPRDNVALGFVARSLGAAAPLAETTDRENRALPDRIVERLRPLTVGGATVAILGLAYKPFSHVVEESQGIYLARALSRAGARVVAYDPQANDSAPAELHGQTVIASSVAECVAQADVVLVTTADPEFAALKAEDFPRRQVTVVDFWRILDPRIAEAAHIKYVAVGRSGDDASNAARLAALWRTPEHA
ncbi:MAG: UDP-glucose dehydrogenase family protein [Acidimicrobiales bacterium]